MKEYQLYATMGAGFESVVNKELQSMGYKTRVENGRVFFKGGQEDIVRTNLWLRTADRIKILLKEFRATDFDTLFNEIYDFDWAELLPVDAKFPVHGKRLKDRESAEELYRQMGEVLRPLSSFSQYYLTADPNFEKCFGAKATKKRKLFNGNLRVDFYQYWANRR